MTASARSGTILTLLVCGLVLSDAAASAGQSASGQSAAAIEAGEYGSDYNGEDITRPESKVLLRLQDKSTGTSHKVESIRTYLQPQGVLALADGWGFAWMAQLPFVAKPITPSGSSETVEEFGLGDIQTQAAFIHPIDQRWAYGLGVRLVSPSARDSLGNGKWQVMPVIGVRYSFLEFGPNTYFVPKVRYAVSFAGEPTRRNISEPQFAPTLSIGLANRWFVILFPSFDIRINYGEPSSGQTGRLFFPIDASVGRKLGDNVVISLEGSVPVIKDYPVYNFKTEFRVSAKF